MSAFIMSEEGFPVLADELASHAENSTRTLDTRYMFAHHIREYLGYNSCPSDAHLSASFKVWELYEANIKAVNQRYENSSPTGNLPFVRRSYFTQWTPIQLIKHLNCLLYQMSEGDVPESEVYKGLEALIAQLCADVVHGLPEYDSANWDFRLVTKAA